MVQTQPSRPDRNRSNPPITNNNYPPNQGTQPGYPYPPQSYYPPPPTTPPQYRLKPSRRSNRAAGCAFLLPFVTLAGLAFLLFVIYLFFPAQSDILLLGLDYSDPSTSVARTDTIILTAFNPWRPKASMLSIPRDLWVTIPGVGENRQLF